MVCYMHSWLCLLKAVQESEEDLLIDIGDMIDTKHDDEGYTRAFFIYQHRTSRTKSIMSAYRITPAELGVSVQFEGDYN